MELMKLMDKCIKLDRFNDSKCIESARTLKLVCSFYFKNNWLYNFLQIFSHSSTCNEKQCTPHCLMFRRVRRHIIRKSSNHLCAVVYVYSRILKMHVDICVEIDCGLQSCPHLKQKKTKRTQILSETYKNDEIIALAKNNIISMAEAIKNLHPACGIGKNFKQYVTNNPDFNNQTDISTMSSNMMDSSNFTDPSYPPDFEEVEIDHKQPLNFLESEDINPGPSCSYDVKNIHQLQPMDPSGSQDINPEPSCSYDVKNIQQLQPLDLQRPSCSYDFRDIQQQPPPLDLSGSQDMDLLSLSEPEEIKDVEIHYEQSESQDLDLSVSQDLDLSESQDYKFYPNYPRLFQPLLYDQLTGNPSNYTLSDSTASNSSYPN